MTYYHDRGLATFPEGGELNNAIPNKWHGNETVNELLARKLIKKKSGELYSVLKPFVLTHDREIMDERHPDYLSTIQGLVGERMLEQPVNVTIEEEATPEREPNDAVFQDEEYS